MIAKLVSIIILSIIGNGLTCEINVTIISKTSQPFRMQLIVPNGDQSDMMTFIKSNQNYTFSTSGKGHDMCGKGIFDMWTINIYELVNDTIIVPTNITTTTTIATDIDSNSNENNIDIESNLDDYDMNLFNSTTKIFKSKWQKAPVKKVYQVVY